MLYKFKLKIPTINSYENESFENAVDLVKDFKEANNDLKTGSLLIRKWIFVNKNKRVSEKMINLIKREKPEVFKTHLIGTITKNQVISMNLKNITLMLEMIWLKWITILLM